MKIKLKAKDVEEYVKHDGPGCPYCEATDVDWSALAPESDTVYRPARCRICGKTWQEIYQLVGIITDDDQEIIVK